MLNIFKMDMRRVFRSKAFYCCIGFMLLVSGTMIFFGLLPGGFAGLIVYLIEKIFISGAFAALILLVFLFVRQIAPAMIIGVIAATGVLSTLITILGEYIGVPLISGFSKYTISGLSGQATLMTTGNGFVAIMIGSVIWVLICSALGAKALKRKDIS